MKPRAWALIAIVSVLSISACEDTPCEDACQDQYDECKDDPSSEDRPLACDRQYDYCLNVCASRPQD